ncbi:MAG: type I glutamate--ammonia ligase [Thermoprotei archaeon]|nr:type I glutamate--ammonia ligase [Thermoprotei archaeon]
MSGHFKIAQLQYVDLAGFLRGVEIPYDSLKNNKFPATFDGSSVYGFAKIEKSDLLLEPIPETLKQIPWQPEAVRVLSRIYEPGGSRYGRDPRLVAEKVKDHLEGLGFKPVVGVEVEFFLYRALKVRVLSPQRGLGYSLKTLESPEGSGYFTQTKKAYHMVEPSDPLMDFRVEFSKALEALGYRSLISHHEVAVSQIEVSLASGDPAYVGDEVVTAKWAARNIARRMGLIALFMPKPVYGDNGSGMHLHASLWDLEGRVNLFSGVNGGLSETARHFIGGLIEHARSLAAIVAPTTNSYRRLVPGYEAPVYCVWGYYNRSAIVRIPAASNSGKLRIEFRAPDPAANPYLAIAATLMAGLDGVKRRLDPGDPYEGNVYKLSRWDLRRLGFKTLPSSLTEALEELDSDREYLKPVFTDDLIDAYIEVKRLEAEEVNMRPHPYEFYMYANL